jgi:PIN domain nuclease of toxin-antitoxin system
VRLLLDTHVVLWWFGGDKRISKSLRELLRTHDHDIVISAATFWEIAIKQARGHVTLELPELEAAMKQQFVELPVRAFHTMPLRFLPFHHRDPFDRLLIAQSIAEGRQLVTSDRWILAYDGVPGLRLLNA